MPQPSNSTAPHTPPLHLDNGHISLIAEIAKGFAANPKPDNVHHYGLRRVAEQLRAEAASLFLLDEDDNTKLVCKACYGPVDITGYQLGKDQGIVGRAVSTQTCQTVLDAAKDPDFKTEVDAETGFTTRSIICAPLIVEDTCLGAVELINSLDGDGLFHDHDVQAVNALAGAAALALLNTRLSETVAMQEASRRELQLAAEIQRNLLPKPLPADAPIHGIAKSAHLVSGDFYDFVPLPTGQFWFAIADVSGKGMNAALLMAKTASLFRCLCKTESAPGRLMQRINKELVETASHGMFVTMIVGIYDPGTDIVRLANGGHEPPLLWDAHRQSYTSFLADAPPLGISTDIIGADGFPETLIPLQGQPFFLFTDGLTEANDGQNGFVGTEGTYDLLARNQHHNGPECLQNIVAQVRQHEKTLRDDLTILRIRKPSAAYMAAACVQKRPMEIELLDITVPANPEFLSVLRAALSSAIATLPLPEIIQIDIQIAVDEAAQNVIRHAYGNTDATCTSRIPLLTPPTIQLRLAHTPTPLAPNAQQNSGYKGDLIVRMIDRAPAIAPECLKGRDLTTPTLGKMGVPIIQSIMDDIKLMTPPHGGGNMLQMVKRFS